MHHIYPYTKTHNRALLRSLLVFAILLCTNCLLAQPVINSFSPVSGPVGTTVTISGSNFSTTPTNNVVFFGAVKAPVTAATSTTLTVTVPTGATYQPVTVTTNGLTGYAQRPFNVTFGLTGLSTSSFTKSTLATGNAPDYTLLSDFDGDGKPELVVNTWAGYFSVYKNNSTIGNVSFVRTDYSIPTGANGIAIGDIDGDGKPDLVLSGVDLNTDEIRVFRNTSTSGTISFDAGIAFVAGSYMYNLSIDDIDGDGKPDIAVADNSSTAISVLKNTSTPGNISFATKISIPTDQYPTNVVLGDLDGDRKPDMVATNNLTKTIAVFRNTSTSGTISFAAKQNFSTTDYSFGIAIGDLDNDGKYDIAIGNNWYSNLIAVFRNTSSPGTISLAAVTNSGVNEFPYTANINDIDGDGKPDLISANVNTTNFSILQNTSTSGTISFASQVAIEVGKRAGYQQTGDIDGDGRPDIIISNVDDNLLSIFLSKSAPTLTGFTPISGAAGTTVTITGTNLDLTNAVSIGGVPVTSYNIVSATTITAVIAAGSKGTITVTTASGTATMDGFGLTPTITSFSPASGSIGTTVTITGSNFSSVTTDNTVYFGSVKANVLSASATTLTVTVPGGTDFQPITVTTNKLTASSAVPFLVTFPTIGATFAANSFGTGVDFTAGKMTYGARIGDVDGDGKNDIVTASSSGQIISIFRNTTVNGSMSFAAKVDYPSNYPYNIILADLDGDGKQDIVAVNSGSISLFKNNCTPGAISFTFLTEIDLPNGLADLVVTDLDSDGKLDLAGADQAGLVILKNTTNGGTVSFDSPVFFTAGYMPGSLAVGDLDGDGKPDFVVTSTDNAVAHNGKISVFRNTMTVGVPFSNSSVAAKIDLATGKATYGVKIADLDGDGKQDIVTNNSQSGTLSIFRNTSTPGTISLATQLNYNTGTSTTLISVNDIDGDGKPDLIIPVNYYKVGLMKNKSTSGTISFAAIVKYDNTYEPKNCSSGDLDGDGKPDIVIPNYSGDGFTIYRNQVAEATVAPSGNSPVTGNLTNNVAVTGSVQLYNGTPYIQRHYDILPVNYAATATATITLYFTQDEFNNFNATAGHGADLPTGPTDATGIANLRIFQYHGTSTSGLPGSYTGSAVAIDPDDSKIVWDATTQWWTVTFDITGFSGFFASNSSFNYLVPSAPVITAGGNTTFCSGGSVTLSSSAAANNQWYRNGTAINGATATTLVVTTSGTYAATASINGVASAMSAGIDVTVNSIPTKPTITRNASQLVSSASSGNQWYKDGAAIAGATGSNFTPTEAGNYSVKVTSNGCTSDESDKFNYTITGVIDLGNNYFIKLSPNPVIDKVKLEFNLAGTTSLTVQIVDMQGRICKTFINQPSESSLNFTGLNNGVYIAKIFTVNQKQHYTIRLLKQ